MAIIHRCQLELHDSLYYATREIGRLYETEPVIHNYALCYALGWWIADATPIVFPKNILPLLCPEQVPKYEEHLTPLNQQSIYITQRDRSAMLPF